MSLKTRIDPRSKDNHTVYMARVEDDAVVSSFTSEKPCTVILKSGHYHYFFKDNGWSSRTKAVQTEKECTVLSEDSQ